MLGTAAAALWSLYVYLWREKLALEGLGLALLRTLAVAGLLILLVNPGRASPSVGLGPLVLLDASLSMNAGGKWDAAVDTAVALAGTAGVIQRFGAAVTPFDTQPPGDAATRLRNALYAARAGQRPIFVVSDGEIEDLGSILPSMLSDVRFVLLPRDTVLDAAILAMDSPARIQGDDSLEVELTLGMWGTAEPQPAVAQLGVDSRVLVQSDVDLSPAPSTSRTRLTVPPGGVGFGEHVLTARIRLRGDSIPEDDERSRLVTVTERPAAIVLVDPPDWEGRFLVSELTELAGTAVRAYAHVTDDRWMELRSLRQVATETIRTEVGRSGLLVVRASEAAAREYERGGKPVWRWPGGVDTERTFAPGDWYLRSQPGASPLAGTLSLVAWDSVPPLMGLVQTVWPANAWVALSARQGRRGVEQPVLIGHDSAGSRILTTAGAGLWRWAFRGGASREAYRTLLAAGLDWLLGAQSDRAIPMLAASEVVARGEPIVFRWLGGDSPDSVAVAITREADSSSWDAILRFDAQGNAVLNLEPGVYEWRLQDHLDSRGTIVVEAYSTEYTPRPVASDLGTSARATAMVERHARDRWLIFVLVIAALAAEWSWRHHRGLA